MAKPRVIRRKQPWSRGEDAASSEVSGVAGFAPLTVAASDADAGALNFAFTTTAGYCHPHVCARASS